MVIGAMSNPSVCTHAICIGRSFGGLRQGQKQMGNVTSCKWWCMTRRDCCAWVYDDRNSTCMSHGGKVLKIEASDKAITSGVLVRCQLQQYMNAESVGHREVPLKGRKIATLNNNKREGHAKYFNVVKIARDDRLLFLARSELGRNLFEVVMWNASHGKWNSTAFFLPFGTPSTNTELASSFAGNLALLPVIPEENAIHVYGGQYHTYKIWPEAPGIMHVRLSDAVYGPEVMLSARSVVLDGKRCLETTFPSHHDHCELDGKLSVAPLGSTIFLYARANVLPSGGGRHIQVSRASHVEGPWGPFEIVCFEQYPLGVGLLPRDDGVASNWNIYYPAIKPNPADGGNSLLGFFNVWTQFDSCIAIALTFDGIHFSKLECIVSARRAGKLQGEQLDHVVDGLVVRGHEVLFFIHRDVPDVYRIRSTEPPSLHEYAMPLGWLQNYTAHIATKMQSATPRVAVLFCCQLRVGSHPKLLASQGKYLGLGEPYDVFYHVNLCDDDPSPFAGGGAKLRSAGCTSAADRRRIHDFWGDSLVSFYVHHYNDTAPSPNSCKVAPRSGIRAHHKWASWRLSLEQMHRHEYERSAAYEIVIFLRPDLLFTRNLPFHASDIRSTSSGIWATTKRGGLHVSDGVIAASRGSAEILANTPRSYFNCWNATQIAKYSEVDADPSANSHALLHLWLVSNNVPVHGIGHDFFCAIETPGCVSYLSRRGVSTNTRVR